MAKRKMGSGKGSANSGNLDALIAFEWKPILSLASGDAFHIPVYTFTGSKPGAPSVYLQSAIHGPEVQGSLVIAMLFEYLKANPPLGNVRMVPNCNPIGLNNKRLDYTDGRTDPVTGDNFNRRYHLPTKKFAWDKFIKEHKRLGPNELNQAFRAKLKAELQRKQTKTSVIAERLALHLQLLSIDFDICLDLHCANTSVRHCYAPDYAREDSAYFGIPNIVLVPNDEFSGAKDEVFFHPWAELALKLSHEKVAVQAFTLELGAQELIEREGAEKDLAGILSYLAHRGVILGKPKKSKPLYCSLEHYETVSSPVGGLAEWFAAPGDFVKSGQLLARILRFGAEPNYTEVHAPVSGVITVRHASSIMHEGAELMKIAQRRA